MPVENSLSLKALDLSQTAELKHYDKRCAELQLSLVRLQRRLVEQRAAMALVFEGMDAAGKGGAIKRLTEYLDPRGVEVHATGAPDPQELRHHYLRRFWLRLPPRCTIAIFDRSWYGRMLVEPIEGYCTAAQYARAGREIREFEQTLCDEGLIILKFWLHVDKEEQLRRFKERENDPLRVWKITADDWRNREKFDQYQEKADAMFSATHAKLAPWHLVAGNDKRFARLKVLELVSAGLEAGLDRL